MVAIKASALDQHVHDIRKGKIMGLLLGLKVDIILSVSPFRRDPGSDESIHAQANTLPDAAISCKKPKKSPHSPLAGRSPDLSLYHSTDQAAQSYSGFTRSALCL